MKVFSRRTLEEFEDASASIPIRRLDRAFAHIRPGDDALGTGGARRIAFRRYVAGVDQRDSQQLEKLGDALGSLIDAVATSKEDFLVKAAERDGFSFANGVFRPAQTVPDFFAITRVEDFASIDDRSRRLYLIANDSPKEAVDGAKRLVESVCRTISSVPGEAAPQRGDVFDFALAALEVLGAVPARSDDDGSAALASKCFRQLGAVVATLDELQNANVSKAHDGGPNGLTSRHARLAIGAAAAFARFVAETYVERAARL